jgi:hypothetical protein
VPEGAGTLAEQGELAIENWVARSLDLAGHGAARNANHELTRPGRPSGTGLSVGWPGAWRADLCAWHFEVMRTAEEGDGEV